MLKSSDSMDIDLEKQEGEQEEMEIDKNETEKKVSKSNKILDVLPKNTDKIKSSPANNVDSQTETIQNFATNVKEISDK